MRWYLQRLQGDPVFDVLNSLGFHKEEKFDCLLGSESSETI